MPAPLAMIEDTTGYPASEEVIGFPKLERRLRILVVREVRARAIILATGSRLGREPQISIAKALGCRTLYDRACGYERLVLDEDGRTAIPGLFAAGDAACLGSEADAEDSGRRAGEAAATS